MDKSEREARDGGEESLPGLLGAASERVQAIIEAAESSAAGILQDAKAEARRYADEARGRIDEVSRERTQRVGALTDELNSLGEELIRQAEAMRAQAQALAGALGRAANEIYSELEEQESELDRLSADAELEAEYEDEFESLEADGPRFAEERTLEPEGADLGPGQNGERRRGLWRGFRRQESEPGTGELAVLDEVADDEELVLETVEEPETDERPQAGPADAGGGEKG